MGLCISVVDTSEVLKCSSCEAEAPAPWGRLTPDQKSLWQREQGKPICRKCSVKNKLEVLKYKKERKMYNNYKEAHYPKPSEGGKSQLKRVRSGETWDSSTSFYDGWKPPSTLKRLLSAIRQAQAEDPTQYLGMQRKPTGFIPSSVPAALPGEAGGAAAASHSTDDQHCPHHMDAVAPHDIDTSAEAAAGRHSSNQEAELHRQFAALEEEHGLESVVEEELWSDHRRKSMSGLEALQEEEGGEEKADEAAEEEEGSRGSGRPRPGKMASMRVHKVEAAA